MATDQTSVIVFRDGMGNYYAIPREEFETYRVPDEHKSRVEKWAGQNDVTGFVEPLVLFGMFAPPPPPPPPPSGPQRPASGGEKPMNFRW